VSSTIVRCAIESERLHKRLRKSGFSRSELNLKKALNSGEDSFYATIRPYLKDYNCTVSADVASPGWMFILNQ